MAKVSIEEAAKFSGGSNVFFSLKEDKEKKLVRFLYKTVNDIDSYLVHQVKVDGKNRWVDCLKNPSDPESKCPLCDAGYKKDARSFILVWDEKEEAAKLWERSASWVDRNLVPVLNCVTSEEIVGTVFKVVRSGKRGDKDTTYLLMLQNSDDVKMEDLQEELPATDMTILKKTPEEMEQFIETGEFPEDSKQEEKTEKRGFKKSDTREVDAEPKQEKPTIGRRNRF